jgi:hypothetical protein
MAQNFRRYINRNIGVAAVTVFTADSYDTIVGVNISNTTGSAVNASVYITNTALDYYLVKNAPIPAGSALQVIDGGAKIIVQSGDALKIISDTATSLDTVVSTVDDIST